MRILDAIQRRALRLVDTDKHQQPAYVTSLEHRRDVSALVVFQKAQVQGILHHGRLRLFPRPIQRCTRTAIPSDRQGASLEAQFLRTTGGTLSSP